MISSSISFTTLVPDPLPIGTYTARLEVSNHVGGSFHSIPVTMHIGELPDPSFDYSTPANAGEPVAFTNTTTPGIPPATDYEWFFGDGETSIEENPSHTYAVGGTYPVSLQACNLAGCDTYYEDVLVISFLYLPIVLK
jgi:PKD repeat protein